MRSREEAKNQVPSFSMRQHGIHLHGKKGNLVARWGLEDGRRTLEADDPLCLII